MTIRFSLASLLVAVCSLDLSATTLPPRQSAPVSPSSPLVERNFGAFPLHFVENRGQVDSRARYFVQGSDKTIYFTNSGLTLSMTGTDESQVAERWTVDLDFVGARRDVRPEGHKATGATFSYFKGARPDWQVGLKSYSEIVYRELWPGIDLVFAGTVNRMKYTFRVKPGADPRQIQLAWRGAKKIEQTADGSIVVATPAGGFTDAAPVSWQNVDGHQVAVATTFKPKARIGPATRDGLARLQFGFQLGEYDRNRELVIDPALLVYAGFLGGSEADEGLDIAVDIHGNAYVTGPSRSPAPSFPATVGPDLSANGNNDVFVAKINAAGTALVYAGFIGGSNSEIGWGIAVDAAGNAFVSGDTSSTQATFPVTVGPDLTYNGGRDAFIAKINPSGTALLYCGYIGGSSDDRGFELAIDSIGNAFVAGVTTSSEASFPVSVGPDLTQNGERDAFVAKVNPTGTGLDYCGYIGGIDVDQIWGIALDDSGNAVVVGETKSSEATFPVTVGPDLTYGGDIDAFVAKIDASGANLHFCGYIGGSSGDDGHGVALDAAGNAYVIGSTWSDETSFPVLVGPDLTHNGSGDAFVAKVTSDGTAFLYAGYIGGNAQEIGQGIAVDSAGYAYVGGSAYSNESTFPVLDGPDLTQNGEFDGFVAKVAPGGSTLEYSGFIGGSDIEFIEAIALDAAGNLYVTGDTRSSDGSFPATPSLGPTYHGGFNDAFVAKIGVPPPDPCFSDEFDDGVLDAGWTLVQVGSADQGAASEISGQLLLTGDGEVLYQPPSDSFVYLRRAAAITGDFRAELDVAGFPVDAGGPYRKTGLMVRASDAANAAMVQISYVPNWEDLGRSTIQFRYRPTTGAAGDGALGSNIDYNVPPALPLRIAIQRTGNNFKVFYSWNGGLTWKKPAGGSQGSITLPAFGPNALVGPLVVSYSASTALTAALDNFEVCSIPTN